MVGFVRAYGKLLEQENVTLTAVCPNKVRTNIAQSAVHDRAESLGVLVSMDKLMEAFEMLMAGGKFGDVSGECLEVAPNRKGGAEIRLVPVLEYINEESRLSAELSLQMQRS